MAATPIAAENPFAAPSSLPYGLPDFASVQIEHFRPALEAGLAEQRAEWEAIASTAEPPTEANTLDALESSGALLDRVQAVFFTLVSSAATDEIRAIEEEFAPRLAEHSDALWLDERIYARITRVAEQLDASASEETRWVLERYRLLFERAGIRLDESDTARLRELNSRISSLETQFSQRVVAGLEAAAVHVPDAAGLTGLSAGAVSSLRQAAQDRAQDGYLITLGLPTPQPIVGQTTNRDLRKRVHTASISRGTGVDPDSDTRPIVLDLARLRAERARLLGYAHHAEYVAQGATAKSTDAVNGMLARLAPAAVRNARHEAAELAAALHKDEPSAEFAPWDWALYADRVREQRYSFDEDDLRPYLELDRVLADGVFFAARTLYGITLTERPDLTGYADGVRVWEVREADGSGLGLFVGDYYAREGKRGGAWMHHLVDGAGLLRTQPVVVNNLNINRPAPGEPTLLTWDEVITAFHEFGHALHGLFTAVRYPSVSGTSVPRDFVEYPSQVNEMWAWHPQVLARFARHHRSGEALPTATLDQLRASQSYGVGFDTTEYLAAAILDQAWHQLTPEQVPTDPAEVETFEAAALEQAGVALALVPPRYRSTYFNHTFGGGYDAGYYSYIWSQVLDADTVDWFREDAAHGEDGGLNRSAGDRFREALLSRGHAQDPLASYRDLRGRDAVIDPLLRRKGLNA
ncbi:M3 family metallopeptidase [Ruania halotolerans]|uniref:M3 family metallopeptidase n=1 Tax=Ruania halotolerans TaxID=2897773 RepID=UPI001E308AB9|nr:M3 family metallopeptidase [Ruania halotolerans]UFU08068.1 M3 family metallopeptidase [Ruania halotolerans]